MTFDNTLPQLQYVDIVPIRLPAGARSLSLGSGVLLTTAWLYTLALLINTPPAPDFPTLQISLQAQAEPAAPPPVSPPPRPTPQPKQTSQATAAAPQPQPVAAETPTVTPAAAVEAEPPRVEASVSEPPPLRVVPLFKVSAPPRPVYTPDPVYPQNMEKQGITSHVTLRFVVDDGGKVTQISVQKSGGPAFDDAAIATLTGWTFSPALLDGQPVAVSLTQTFRFELN